MPFRVADMLFRFRLKGLILMLLALHSFAMIFVSVSAMTHGSTVVNKCKLIDQHHGIACFNKFSSFYKHN